MKLIIFLLFLILLIVAPHALGYLLFGSYFK